MTEQALANAFIVLYLALAWAWPARAGSRTRKAVKRYQRQVVALGLWHNWNVFLPNPPRANITLSARLWLDDGTCMCWRPATLGTGGSLRAFLEMRQRKYLSNLIKARNRWYREPFVTYLVHQHDLGARRIVRCDLLELIEHIPHPSEKATGSPQIEQYLICVWEP